MMPIKKLLNNNIIKASSWYVFTDFFVSGLSFLTIPIFTRLLTPNDYGIVSTYNSWVGIFTVLIPLGLEVSIGRGKTDFKDEYEEYSSSVLFLSLLFFLIFSVIIFNLKDIFNKVLELPNEYLLYFLILQSYLSFVINFAITKFRFQYKYKFVSIINIVRSIIGILLSIYFINFIFENNKYFGRILGNFLPLMIISIFFLFFIFLKGKSYINLKYWKYALFLSIPFIPHHLSSIINSQFDRILINRYIGPTATGIYSFSYNLSMIVMVLIKASSAAWLPWFNENMNNKNFDNIKQKAKYYVDLFIIIYLLILYISPEITKLMADEKYWEGLFIIPYIFLALFFQFLFMFESHVELFFKKTIFISIGTMISAFINVILNILFIPIYGYPAAAYTTLISYIFLFFIHFIFTKKIIKKSIFGFKFYIFPILIVSFYTILFVFFQNIIYIRIVLIVFLWFIYGIKYLKKYKSYKY